MTHARVREAATKAKPLWLYERDEIGRVGGEGIDLVGVTIDRDVQAPKGQGPAGRKVVAVEMGKAEGCDVGRADPGAVETFCQRSRTNAGVDKHDTGRRPEDRCVSGRPAGKDADFEGHSGLAEVKVEGFPSTSSTDATPHKRNPSPTVCGAILEQKIGASVPI